LTKISRGEADNLYGAILGDCIGSAYEFDRGGKAKDFPVSISASAASQDHYDGQTGKRDSSALLHGIQKSVSDSACAV